MLYQLPPYVSVVFGLTTLLSIWLFWRAAQRSGTVLAVLLGWLLLQGAVGLSGFYLKTDSLPPRFPALVIPPLLLLIGLLLTKAGRAFIDSLSISWLTLLHVVRIPVEVVLFWLFVGKTIPELMTFEGRNFDILSGLTAPVIYYVGFIRKSLPKSVLLVWNLLCLGLLINIVSTAALSVPSPLQQLAFDQPNIAILYFPFVWLPSVVVPIVLLAHVSAIRKLIN
ncbi:hypothetical protein J2I47_18095 [Fibrella sp. HMF5335]|uniref:Uncharacterized protein n=1 Tax=Fibrella rubiginis TaxID=2817060 RepID=A0A939K650_9BACT|nr:hypothetical protein [Fibrella rubiginis]MBO0938468.1 hypothetical protein [Fibrella rubiginis]